MSTDDTTIRRAAASTLIEVMQELALAGQSVLGLVMTGVAVPQCEVHYPAGDVIDADSGYRYYYHSHAAAPWQRREHGHFHLFSTADKAYTHLMAISVDGRGLPLRMFTTNRWVTAETWQPHARVYRQLRGFCLAESGAMAQVNRWLAALLTLFSPAAGEVLAQRDRRVAALTRGGREMESVFEDRRVHVLSQARLSLIDEIAALG